MNPHDLAPAYRRTTYRLRSTPPIDIRVDQVNPALDDWLRARTARTWAFITAFNPRSQPQSDDANTAADVALHDRIVARGLRAAAADAISDDARWPVERGWLIVDIDCDAACALAREFVQNAVICGRTGAPARLVFCQ